MQYSIGILNKRSHVNWIIHKLDTSEFRQKKRGHTSCELQQMLWPACQQLSFSATRGPGADDQNQFCCFNCWRLVESVHLQMPSFHPSIPTSWSRGCKQRPGLLLPSVVKQQSWLLPAADVQTSKCSKQCATNAAFFLPLYEWCDSRKYITYIDWSPCYCLMVFIDKGTVSIPYYSRGVVVLACYNKYLKNILCHFEDE